jgi:cytochrome c2
MSGSKLPDALLPVAQLAVYRQKKKKKGAACYNWCKDLLAPFLARRDKNSRGASICTHRNAKNKNAYGLFAYLPQEKKNTAG